MISSVITKSFFKMCTFVALAYAIASALASATGTWVVCSGIKLSVGANYSQVEKQGTNSKRQKLDANVEV